MPCSGRCCPSFSHESEPERLLFAMDDYIISGTRSGVCYAHLRVQRHYSTYLPTTCKSGSILHRHSIYTYPTSNFPLNVYWADVGRHTYSPGDSLAHRCSGQYVTTSTLDYTHRVHLRAPFLVRWWAKRRRSIILVALMNFSHMYYMLHLIYFVRC